MAVGPKNAMAAALAERDAGRLAEAYRMLLPLAEAGDAEAQAHVGSLMAYSLHRFENFEPHNADDLAAIDEPTVIADREAGAAFLAAASAAGIGAASFNLASLYVAGYGGGERDDRKARAAELYALAHAQGFTAFGWLTQGDEPGQPYLDIMERHAAGESPAPAKSRRAESGGGHDRQGM